LASTILSEIPLTYVEGAKKLRMVILDACRENPFLAKMLRKDPSRSIGRGLARYEPAPGSIVVFAAKEGQIALDGDAPNSPFARPFSRTSRCRSLTCDAYSISFAMT
jgi:hypothetical protein